jgi:hypothetical protein
MKVRFLPSHAASVAGYTIDTVALQALNAIPAPLESKELSLRDSFNEKWDRRTDYKPAAPCLAIEIVAGAAWPVTPARRADDSALLRTRNAILVLT